MTEATETEAKSTLTAEDMIKAVDSRLAGLNENDLDKQYLKAVDGVEGISKGLRDLANRAVNTGFTTSRLALRKMASPILEGYFDTIYQACLGSSFLDVETGDPDEAEENREFLSNPNPIKIRPSASSLRDAMSVPGLSSLVTECYEEDGSLRDPKDVHRAVARLTLALDVAHVFSRKSDKAGHGYVVGMPVQTHMEGSRQSKHLRAMAKSAPKEVEAKDDYDKEEVKAAETVDLPEDPAKLGILDLALAQAGLPNIRDLITKVNESATKVADASSEVASMKRALEAAKREKYEGVEVEAKTEAASVFPKGKVGVAKAHEVFGITGAAKSSFDFDVPVWNWDGDHPHVPEIDTKYIFKPEILMRVLYAINANERAYLHGHTGSGKTTFIEQVAARLNWPFARVNFDSEITRMDLIGRDVLKDEGGKTVSIFAEGILPQVMSQPYILACDEIDFVRPDVAYVMQRALEGNGLMLTEDGGRVVKPHPLFRIFATGNTVGQGDEFGMYQGARPQSMAFLDRFTVWAKVDYMSAEERKKLIAENVPSLDGDTIDQINAYINEHLEAFMESKVLQPLSPRGFVSLANCAMSYYSMFPKSKRGVALKKALATVVLDRASSTDRATLKGIANRTFR